MTDAVIGIFEDDKIHRFAYERIFERLDHKMRCYIFDTPEKGYATAKEIKFDIVFIEVHFWGENFGGISILNEIKKTNPNLIAVAMTSLLQEGDLERILTSGFNMCLEKPVAFHELNMLYKTLH